MRVDVVDPASATARDLLGRYLAELAERFPTGFDVQVSGTADDDELREPHGRFLVVHLDDEPVACAAVRRLEGTTAEVKRMYVDPSARGRGVGRGLLGALEDAARALGCDVVVLDTSAHLPEALGLYRSSGYVETAPYNDNPYAAHWFEKRL